MWACSILYVIYFQVQDSGFTGYIGLEYEGNQEITRKSRCSRGIN
jgi:hypothetical protein